MSKERNLCRAVAMAADQPTLFRRAIDTYRIEEINLLSANFIEAEYKIILAIIDKPWGFGKDNDSIAIGQFAKMTNLSGRTIQIIRNRTRAVAGC